MNTRLLREFIRSSIHIGKLNESNGSNDFDTLPEAALLRASSFLVNASGGDGIGTGKLRAVMDSREASMSGAWTSDLGTLISAANKWDKTNEPSLVPGGTALLCCHVIVTGDYNNAMWALGGIISILRNIPGISNPFTNTSGASPLKEGPASFIDKTFTRFGSASKTALEQSIIVMEKLIASDNTALETIETSSADATFDASKINVNPLKYNNAGMMELTGEQLPLTLAFKSTMTNTWQPEISDELQACMNTYSSPANAAGLKSFSQLTADEIDALARSLDPEFDQLSWIDQQDEIMRLNNLRLEADAVSRKTTADIEKLSTPAAIKELVDTMIRRKGFVGSMLPIRYSSAVARAAKTSAKVGKGTAAAGLVLGGGAGLLDALYDTVSEPRFENFKAVCNDSLNAMKSDAQMLENEINNIDPTRYADVKQKLADLQRYSLD